MPDKTRPLPTIRHIGATYCGTGYTVKVLYIDVQEKVGDDGEATQTVLIDNGDDSIVLSPREARELGGLLDAAVRWCDSYGQPDEFRWATLTQPPRLRERPLARIFTRKGK